MTNWITQYEITNIINGHIELVCIFYWLHEIILWRFLNSRVIDTYYNEESGNHSPKYTDFLSFSNLIFIKLERIFVQIGRKRSSVCKNVQKALKRSWWNLCFSMIKLKIKCSKWNLISTMLFSCLFVCLFYSNISTNFMESIHWFLIFSISVISVTLTTCDHKLKRKDLLPVSFCKYQLQYYWPNILA